MDSRDLQINIVVGENVLLICILYSDYEKDRTLKEKKALYFYCKFSNPQALSHFRGFSDVKEISLEGGNSFW